MYRVLQNIEHDIDRSTGCIAVEKRALTCGYGSDLKLWHVEVWKGHSKLDVTING
jgi:hypothetical protein